MKWIICLLLFLVFIYRENTFAFECGSYATCHYQTNPALTCPDPEVPEQSMWDQPYHACFCYYNSSTSICTKNTFDLCWNQTACSEWMVNMGTDCWVGQGINPGDCCYCSGAPAPTATATPTPTATLTPTLTPIPNAPPSFVSLVIKNTAGTVIGAEN